MKTKNEILTDVCTVIKDSPINDLSGGIYKRTRPTDSVLEDCVANLIPGVGGKFYQDGGLSVKLFYIDTYQDNTYSEDAVNGQTKEQLLLNLSETLLKLNGYSFEISSRETYTNAVEEIHQHYAILKINYKILN